MTKKECLERFDIEIACQMMREGKNQRENRIYHIQGKTTDYWKVIINASDKVKKCIYDFLYKDATIFLSRKRNLFNTEITYNIANRVISIVEHRLE